MGFETKHPLSFQYLREYLAEYYPSLTVENQKIGEALAEEVATLHFPNTPLRRLDVGCGPTLHYWDLFLHQFARVVGMDGRQDNLEFLAEHEAKGLTGEIPTLKLMRYDDVCEYVQKRWLPHMTVQEIFRASCERLERCVCADMKQETWPFDTNEFHCVTSIFALEHVDNMTDFYKALQEVRRVLCPGGRLVFVHLADTTVWKINGGYSDSLYLDEQILEKALEATGYSSWSIRSMVAETAIEKNQGYNRMLVGHATK